MVTGQLDANVTESHSLQLLLFSGWIGSGAEAPGTVMGADWNVPMEVGPSWELFLQLWKLWAAVKPGRPHLRPGRPADSALAWLPGGRGPTRVLTHHAGPHGNSSPGPPAGGGPELYTSSKLLGGQPVCWATPEERGAGWEMSGS